MKSLKSVNFLVYQVMTIEINFGQSNQTLVWLQAYFQSDKNSYMVRPLICTAFLKGYLQKTVCYSSLTGFLLSPLIHCSSFKYQLTYSIEFLHLLTLYTTQISKQVSSYNIITGLSYSKPQFQQDEHFMKAPGLFQYIFLWFPFIFFLSFSLFIYIYFVTCVCCCGDYSFGLNGSSADA